MEMTLQVKLGNKQRIITPEELSKFEAMLQLNRIAPGRCSRLFIAELLLWNEINGHDPSQVTRQIEVLENLERYSGTKKATEFKRKPLKGLWHKHFFDAHNLVHNITNEWAGNKLNNLITEICDPSKSEFLTSEMMEKLADRIVHGTLEDRDHGERLTGEWIIFDKEKETNYYLCLARHSDGDEAIFSKIQTAVFPEFQYLKYKYY